VHNSKSCLDLFDKKFWEYKEGMHSLMWYKVKGVLKLLWEKNEESRLLMWRNKVDIFKKKYEEMVTKLSRPKQSHYCYDLQVSDWNTTKNLIISVDKKSTLKFQMSSLLVFWGNTPTLRMINCVDIWVEANNYISATKSIYSRS